MHYLSYVAPRWLPGGHAQTIYPAKFFPKPLVQYRRERWETPDGDFIDLDCVDGVAGRPFVVLFHGLEGSSDSHYAKALMAHLYQQGWSGAVVHFRGCSGTINRMPRFYHSGDSAEIDWIIRRLRLRYTHHFYAVGVSLGGNALLRWLGESQSQAGMVDAACAVSTPLDLAASGAALSGGMNRLYTHNFLRTLKKQCLKKLEQFPDLFSRTHMLAARNLYEFDNVVTAPLHGYRDTDDYWHRASAKQVIMDITVPTLILNAQNDPFLPARHLPHRAARSVMLEYPKEGGHAGFITSIPRVTTDWLPQRMTCFLERY